jgi:hypothetical protein
VLEKFSDAALSKNQRDRDGFRKLMEEWYAASPWKKFQILLIRLRSVVVIFCLLFAYNSYI